MNTTRSPVSGWRRCPRATAWPSAGWLNWGNMYSIAPFYVLILILLIKPYGLFGTKNIERV